jgi:hypothetical protein
VPLITDVVQSEVSGKYFAKSISVRSWSFEFFVDLPGHSAGNAFEVIAQGPTTAVHKDSGDLFQLGGGRLVGFLVGRVLWTGSLGE